MKLCKHFTDNLFIFASANPHLKIDENDAHQSSAALIEDCNEDFKDNVFKALTITEIKVNF